MMAAAWLRRFHLLAGACDRRATPLERGRPAPFFFILKAVQKTGPFLASFAPYPMWAGPARTFVRI